MSGSNRTMEDATIPGGFMTCAAWMASCECSLDVRHEGPHICECEGSWDDKGNIKAWPEKYVGPKGGIEERSCNVMMPFLRAISPDLDNE